MTTVLVTGVGAIIGYGVLRALRTLPERPRLVGADIYPDAAGQAWCDAFEQAPLTSDPGYFDWLQRVVAAHGIYSNFNNYLFSLIKVRFQLMTF